MSLRRADLRFALPRPVRRAVVLGGLEGWAEGLTQAGVQAAIEATSEAPELVIAPAHLAGDALALAPELLILEGRARLRTLRALGWSGRLLLPLPGVERPELLLPAGMGAATRYALRRRRGGTSPVTRARNALAGELLARGIVPSGRSPTTIAARSDAPPFMVAAALDALPVDEVAWFAAIGRWAKPFSRGVFYLFPPGEPDPAWVVKFARMPGLGRLFDRDEQAMELVRLTGPVVAEHAPRLISRFDVQGLEACIETAAPGSHLMDVLRSSVSREARLAAIGRVASWIVQLAGETAAPPETLQPELRRIAAEVVPRWTDEGVSATLVDDLLRVPAVFQHGDLWAENIFVDRSGFTVVDWESATAHGMPLWDMLYFLTDALGIIDGVANEQEREDHFVRLWLGSLPSSEVLFHWTRAAVDAAAVPAEAVGPMASLLWLSYAIGDLRNAERAERIERRPGTLEPSTLRFARRWLTEPGLGLGWDRWRA